MYAGKAIMGNPPKDVLAPPQKPLYALNLNIDYLRRTIF